MSAETTHLSALWRVVRRRWALLAVYTLVGALLGLGASVLLFSPGYQSRSSVLLQGPLEQDELRTQALVATSSVVLSRTAKALDGAVSAEELRNSVVAQVLDGNVIAITVSQPSATGAQRVADRLTQEYVTYSRELVARARGGMRELLESLRQQLRTIDQRVDALVGSQGVGLGSSGELAQLRSALGETRTSIEGIAGDAGGAAFGRASIVVLEPATLPTSIAPPTLPQLSAGGAVLFGLLGLLGHVVSDRRNRKPMTEPDIAAALGSPVLGSVDLAVSRSSSRRAVLSNALNRLVGKSPAAAVESPSSEDDRQVRYRRVLSRLKSGRNANLRMLLVVADDDATAHRAIAELAVASATGRGPTVVVTDDAGFTALIREAMGNSENVDTQVTIAPSADPEPAGRRIVLRIVSVDPARPTVPERARARGALVVVTAGTRSAWELVGMAEACADAGHDVIGALVSYRADTPAPRPSPLVDFDTYQVSTNGSAKAATP